MWHSANHGSAPKTTRGTITGVKPLKIALSSHATVNIRPQGRERQPVIIIDNALPYPNAIVENACANRFTRIGAYYPGIRATIDREFRDNLFASVGDIINDAFNLKAERWSGECFYSIVTTPPANLLPIQRLPHYDGVEENRMAVLCYLCKPEQGGTSFYRHKATGFETIGADRFDLYKRTLEAEVRKHGLPPARYIENGAPLFECITTIDAVFNRMVIYRGKTLHCSAIDNTSTLPADPKTGRLTINAFMTP
jgi:Family of unknown function (DUF6445)